MLKTRASKIILAVVIVAVVAIVAAVVVTQSGNQTAGVAENDVMNDDGSRTVTMVDKNGKEYHLTIPASSEEGEVAALELDLTEFEDAEFVTEDELKGLKVNGMSYAEYLAMSADDQYAFYQTFDNIKDFYAWFQAAKALYEEAQDSTILDAGGVIDASGK